MKDYYRILQVDPQAEQDVIEAAYWRLMRKYHPDVLSPEERDLEGALQRARELNEAYGVLGDVQKRREYDLRCAVGQPRAPQTKPEGRFPASQSAEVEYRVYLVRCSTTRRTFRMFLGRRKGWSGPFVVTGFELEEDALSRPPANQNAAGLWGKLLATLASKRNVPQRPIKELVPTAEETIQDLFDAAGTLSMGEIEWAGHRCPDCAGETINPNGTTGTWSRCGTCHRLKCAGSTRRRSDGCYSTCPWCGATNKTTRSVATGSKEQAILRGEYRGAYNQVAPSPPERKRKVLSGKGES